MNSLLFEITDETMREFWRNCVRNIKGCHKNCLGNANDDPSENSWVSHLHENEKEHALVLRLLQQMMDPAIVMFKRSETPQVAMHTSNHAWHTCDSLKYNASEEPISFVHSFRVVPRKDVKCFSDGSN